MPLAALWGYYLWDHVEEAPKIFYPLWILGSWGLVLTVAFTLYHIVHDQMSLEATLNREGYPVTPFNVQLIQTICALPIWTACVAFTALWVPPLAMVLELLIAVFSCVAIGSMVQYFLHSLGEPPYPRKLMKKVPMKRWWCGSLCGGVNDMLPGLGLLWSKEPHHLTITDLRFAFRVVVFFIWTYVLLSVLVMAVNTVPTQVIKDSHGWCHYPRPLSELSSVIVTVAAVSSTFVGSAGLSIISNAVSYALGEADADAPKEMYNVKRKAAVGTIYLQLPLLKVMLPLLPLEYLQPWIYVPKTDYTGNSAYGGWQSTGEYVKCPIYDRDVMIHMVYGTMVCLLMAYTSYHNMILYLPSRDRDVAKELREELETRLTTSTSRDTMDSQALSQASGAS
ncbi:unnamed protein product [Symbiodinium natans]|uniref:Uncharacterized protein n=1 Tax=Symbiodinium natans TaxID=878477 RepID=A0A812R4Z0_9DINO|nr:unnamed protein product [Symbiodinium natans]